jgi:hypothetical protein
MNKHLLELCFLKTFFDTKIATTKFLKWQALSLFKRRTRSWASKVKMLQKDTPVVRSYFKNHHGAKAVVNAFQFKVTRR